MKTYTTITAPGTNDYPITLEEARIHLRAIGNDDEDQMIRSKIKTAVSFVENQTGMLCAPRTLKLTQDGFDGSDKITIDRFPVTEITSIQYYDENNDLQTIAPADYTADLNSQPARIFLNAKTRVSSRPGSVILTFKAGFIIQSVPHELKEAALLTLAHLYDNRGDEGHRTIAKSVYDLVYPLKQMTF